VSAWKRYSRKLSTSGFLRPTSVSLGYGRITSDRNRQDPSIFAAKELTFDYEKSRNYLGNSAIILKYIINNLKRKKIFTQLFQLKRHLIYKKILSFTINFNILKC